MAAEGFGWAIVQHSGYGYNDNPQFQHAVETRSLPNKSTANMVTREGGLIFASYGEAEAFCDKANYPADHPDDRFTLTPHARGTFSAHSVDGLCIYIPVRTVVG